MKLLKFMWDLVSRVFVNVSNKILSDTASKTTRFLFTCIIWFILIGVFFLYLYGLWYLGKEFLRLHDYNLFRLPTHLRQFFLPALGLLVVLIGFVLYYTFVTWDAEPETSPFPDLDSVWNGAMEAVKQAGIKPHRVSLFLVLGRPESPEANMFDGAGVKWVVKYPAHDPTAPIHVYAEKESSPKSANPGAIYVTCRGASVLGELGGFLARETSVTPDNNEANDGINPDQTVLPIARDAKKAMEVVAAAQGREMTILEKRKAYRAALAKPLGSFLLANGKEVNRLKARLAHLCQLIGRTRGSECAGNGILLLIPLAGTDTHGEAESTAQACLEDLNTARVHMKVDCPMVSLLVDIEDLPGSAELFSLLSSKEKAGRRGCSFPMSTRLSASELRDQIRRSLAWACTTYLQDSIYTIFQTESEANKEVPKICSRNSCMAMLLTEMNERTDAVCNIVMSAMLPENKPMFRYSGFYLAATGPSGQQAFIPGVFQKLVKEQASVTWTQAALDADAECYAAASRYATTSYVLLFVLALLIACFVLYVVPRLSP